MVPLVVAIHVNITNQWHRPCKYILWLFYFVKNNNFSINIHQIIFFFYFYTLAVVLQNASFKTETINSLANGQQRNILAVVDTLWFCARSTTNVRLR
jgi:hypothetical protein